MAKFPDFIIIGAMKCGTTVLWRNLDMHPGVSMGKNWDDPKKTSTEIRFWNNGGPHHTWKTKGVEWYKTLFSGDCCGEKSANYIESNDAFKRMRDYIPNVKLVLCIRNPVNRAYSEYQMQRHTAPRKHTRGFDAAVNDKGYRKRGRYYELISNNVLPYFPKEQLYCVIQERMYKNTQKEIDKLSDFLGVERALVPVNIVDSKDRDKKMKSYRKWQTKYGPMSEKSKNELKKYYSEYNKQLFEFLGEEIVEWA